MICMKRVCLTGLVLAGLGLAMSPAGAQSFNCAYAKYADEKQICRSRSLGRLDEKMVLIFEDVLARAPLDLINMLRAEQGAWLASRHRCKLDTRCIRLHYNARTRELLALFRLVETQAMEPEIRLNPDLPPRK